MKHLTRYQAQVVKQGEIAKRRGLPLSKNPHPYNSCIEEHCLWAAGWHDAK
jgi:hypothetical protein